MPSLEIPPPESPPESQPDAGRARAARGRGGRYGELDHSDLVHLLDEIDDERARARFREAIYISLIIWLVIGWLGIFGVRYLPHPPRIQSPNDTHEHDENEMTYLETPRDVARAQPRTRSAPKAEPTSKAEPAPKAVEAPRAAEPAPQRQQQQQPAPKQAPPAPQPQQQAAAPQPPPPVRQPQPTPLPSTPRPTRRATVDAPKPAPTRPNFGQQGQTAGDAIRRAAQAAAQGGGGDIGTSAPVGRSGGLNTGVDVLSDTMGVDFNPYLRTILRQIYNQWIPLIPEEARPPLNKQGETEIRFTILPDGRIGAMHLDGSTHDDALNRAAWGSITGVGQSPPLPNQFHGPNLELRIHYLVNKKPE